MNIDEDILKHVVPTCMITDNANGFGCSYEDVGSTQIGNGA